MVFDGADRLEVLKEFKDIFDKGSILITTRNPDFNTFLPESKLQAAVTRSEIALQPFPEDVGSTVLRRLAKIGPDEDDAVAHQISKQLGGWPLAISQMAGVIRNQYLTLSEFHERYNDIDERRNLQSTRSNGPVEVERGTMASVCMESFISPQAHVLLDLYSMMDPDCIQESLFTNAIGIEGFPLAFPESEPAYTRARAFLLSASLLQRNRKRQELWIHRVVQDTVRGRMDSERFDEVFKCVIALIEHAWGSIGPDPDQKDVLKLGAHCTPLLPHVLHLHYLHERNGRKVKPSTHFARLLSDAAR